MLRIEEVTIDVPLPAGDVGMVIMQPFVELETSTVPYKWKSDKKDAQINKILKTLDIAKSVNHGCDRIHFTLFSEYSIPGLDGIHRINDVLLTEAWQKGTIVVGGVDGLTQPEYRELLNQPDTFVTQDNHFDRVPQNFWINCYIAWIKVENGQLKKYVQPKLDASLLEKNVTSNIMFTGRSVYIFKGKFTDGRNYRILPLICFDWIAQIGDKEGIFRILTDINTHWNGSEQNLSFMIVLQSNPKPNDNDFLQNAKKFFTDRMTFPFVNRNDSLIIFTNTAGGLRPGKYLSHGCSSIIASPTAPYYNKACPPSFAVFSAQLRGNTILSDCKDAIFREKGECVHSFKIRPPLFINLDPAGRCLQVIEAFVHALCTVSDLRTSGDLVPASIKWINDELDDIKSLLVNEDVHALKTDCNNAFSEITNALRLSTDNKVLNCIMWSSCNYDKWLFENSLHNVDLWGVREKNHLETLLHALSIMKVYSGSLSIDGETAHATMLIGDNVFDIFVVSGAKTHRDALSYSENFVKVESRYIIIVTKDEHDRSVDPRRDKAIYTPEPEINLERGPLFYGDERRSVHCGFHNLKEACFTSTNLSELKTKVNELIGLR